jgi:hypothetical protein
VVASRGTHGRGLYELYGKRLKFVTIATITADCPGSVAMSRQMIGTRGNLTSSMGTTAAQGAALGTAVNISERPVTQQGMRGMKTTHGPARKVQDSSYYVGVLRNKVNTH